MKNLKKIIVFSTVCFLVISLISGCATATPDPVSTNDSTSEVSDETPSAETPPETVQEPEIKLAFILKTLGNPYWVAMQNGILAEAEAQGIVADVFAAENESDFEGQLAIFENVMNNPDYAGIGFAPLSAVSLVSAAGEATRKGIPLVNIDERCDPEELEAAGGKILAYFTTDNVAVGANGAKAIADMIGNTGKVAIVEGMPGVAAGEARKIGATEYFDSIPGITVVASQPGDWDRQKALDVAANILQVHPDLKGFYCANDTMALGVAQAVINAGLEGKVFVVGTDGHPEAFDAVEAGMMLATVAQDPGQMGATALVALLEAIKAGKVATTADPGVTYIDSILVTKDNVSSFIN